MKFVNPITVKIISSDSPEQQTGDLEFSLETKLALMSLAHLARFTKNRLLSQGYSILDKQVIDPAGRVIYEEYTH